MCVSCVFGYNERMTKRIGRSLSRLFIVPLVFYMNSRVIEGNYAFFINRGDKVRKSAARLSSNGK